MNKWIYLKYGLTLYSIIALTGCGNSNQHSNTGALSVNDNEYLEEQQEALENQLDGKSTSANVNNPNMSELEKDIREILDYSGL